MSGTEGTEQYGWELGKLLEKTEELEDEQNQYVEQVDLYKKGQVPPQTLKATMYGVAESLSEIEGDVLDAERTFSNVVRLFETNETSTFDMENRMDEELRQKLIEEGFEVVESRPGSGYEVAVTENELAYQSFLESYGEPDFVDEDLSRGEQLKQIVGEVRDRYDDLMNEAMFYEVDFLSENLGTVLADPVLDMEDGNPLVEFQQMAEREQAEEIRKNPRDVYLGGFESETGVEDLETARAKVREDTPRGKLENQGPSEDELRENNEAISEKLEEVRGRDPRGIY